MQDHQTGTIWTHLDGKAIAGPLEGRRLKMVPIPQMTWSGWKAGHADTLVLDPNTPFNSRYAEPIGIGAYEPSDAIYGDNRLPSNTRVVGVEVDGVFKGYPLSEIGAARGVINDTLAGQPIVVVYDRTAKTALAYLRRFDGQTLEFYNADPNGFEIRDRETDSLWDVHGRTTGGVYGEARLDFAPSFISEWYGWSGYHPESQLYPP